MGDPPEVRTVMRDRRSYLLVVLAVVAVSLTARTVTLHWSPLPATLDGFGYAALARDIVAAGGYPFGSMRADNFVFGGALAGASLLVGEPALVLAQPLVAVVGAVSCLVGVVLARAVARGQGWSPGRAWLAAAVAGLALAVEGLFVRRTGVPDEEAVGLLLAVLLALALHRTLDTRRPAWFAVVVLFGLALPATHTFSSLLAALAAVAVVAAHAPRARVRTLLPGALVAGGFALYVAGYYWFASSVGLSVPYVGRVLSYPGLFVAWVLVLVVGAAWLRGASTLSARATLLVPVAVGFAVVAGNIIVPVFPGTITSPPVVVALLSAYAIPAALAAWSLPTAARGPAGPVVVGVLFAPVASTFFGLTAALRPEYFGIVLRSQTLVHFPALALAAVTVVGIGKRVEGRHLRTAAVVLLLAAALVTAPVAYVDLDTVAYPSTTTEAEFAGAGFAAESVDGTWTSEHTLVRVGELYHGAGAGTAEAASWLRGGSCPDRPMLSQRSWTTTGAHLFPAAPATVSTGRYGEMLASRHLVYATTGPEELAMTLPSGEC